MLYGTVLSTEMSHGMESLSGVGFFGSLYKNNTMHNLYGSINKSCIMLKLHYCNHVRIKVVIK